MIELSGFFVNEECVWLEYIDDNVNRAIQFNGNANCYRVLRIHYKWMLPEVAVILCSMILNFDFEALLRQETFLALYACNPGLRHIDT